MDFIKKVISNRIKKLGVYAILQSDFEKIL